MYKSTVLVCFAILTSCSTNKKEVLEASKSICFCYENYNENNFASMLATKHCLDSIKETGAVESIGKNKLLKQLKRDCPKTAKILQDITN